MLKVYFHTGPNPMKVALFLEESGLPHEVVPVDTRRGQQFDPAFKAINPNSKTPALEDDGVRVFDSNAILLYLAEKSGQFLPPPAERAELLSWLMFVATGVGPYSGQAVHFRHAAPPFDYAINRYVREVARHYQILDERLAHQDYMLASGYSIVDMALWGWANVRVHVMGEAEAAAFGHVTRWHERVSARPAAQRAREWGSRFDFKKEMDDEARRFLFPQNAALVA